MKASRIAGRVFAVGLVTLVAFTALGCGGAKEQLVAVSGKVTVGKNLLKTGTVIYKPDAKQGNQDKNEYRSPINGEGQYSFVQGDKEGIPAGKYLVAVVASQPGEPKPGESKDYPPPKWLAPEKYADPTTSKLTKEVKADAAAGAYDLALDPLP